MAIAAIAALFVAAAWWFLRPDDLLWSPAPVSGPAQLSQAATPGTGSLDGLALARTEVESQSVDQAASERSDEPTSVTVHVVDHEGRPLSRVSIRVAVPGRWGTFRNARTSLTDSDGYALFEGYSRDDVWAEVQADTLPSGHIAARRIHGSLKRQAAVTLTLVCPATGKLVGRLCRASGEPVDGVWLRMTAIDHDAKSQRRKTDERGRFRLERAHPGKWCMQLQVDDRHALIGLSVPPPLTVLVAPGGTTPADLFCRSRGEWIFGRVIDAQDRGVAGILVYAGGLHSSFVEAAPETAGDGIAFAQTDALGYYRLGPLPPERLAVQVGSRHGSSGVTRDHALFESWPAPFFATPGDGVEHVTNVLLVDDVITWRVRPKLHAFSAQEAGTQLQRLTATVGWCRLFHIREGVWIFSSERCGEARLLKVSNGPGEWRIRLPEPDGNVAEMEIELPPRK